jgi:uncharacterized protein YaaW (UPF0174 family)
LDLKREYGKKVKKTRVKQGLEKRIWEKTKKLGLNRNLKREYGKKTKKTRIKQGLEKRIWEKSKKN